MSEGQTRLRTLQGIQKPLIAPSYPVVLSEPLVAKGAVYTKRWVVDLILDLAGYKVENKLAELVAIEPAAGDGAFLSAMIERLTRSAFKQGIPIQDCGNALLAYELDTDRALRSQRLCSQMLLDHGVELGIAQRLSKAWIRTGDYLFESTRAEADFVIGNPPYVRLEEIPEEVLAFYRHTYAAMRGRADLYIAFFEAALRQLKINGTCAFICADRWMRNQYGSELRRLVTAHYSVDVVIEMHQVSPFHDEVDAYPAITVIRKKPQESTLVATAGSMEKSAAELLPCTLQDLRLGESRSNVNGIEAAMVAGWFSGSEPWPCQTPEQLSLLRRLEQNFPPLEKNAKVGIGVATGNDGVFITQDAELVESSRLLKLAMVEDVSSGILNWSGRYLVNPWDADGLVNLTQFPRLRAYFEAHGEALRKRHTAQQNPRGWYKTIDRVSPSLSQKSKLYIADIKDSLEPVLDEGDTYPHHNLYFIESERWDLRVLGGLLLSSIAQFFVESYCVRMRGGYFRFQAQYLRRIRLPDPEMLTLNQSDNLRKAFQTRDRELATVVARDIYQIKNS